jgi:hypothetical protein
VFGGSACDTCVRGACGAERTACASDTSCAARVSCLDRCALAPSGNIDAACAAACGAPSGNVSQSYDDCRTRAAAACVPCGGSAAADAGGGSAIDCVNACTGADAGNEYECNIACYQKDRTATQQLGELVACNIAKCSAKEECGPIDACSACQYEKCTAYSIECQANPDCQLLSKCILSECPEGRVDSICLAGCEKRFPGAVALHRQQTQCSVQQCAQPCR